MLSRLENAMQVLADNKEPARSGLFVVDWQKPIDMMTEYGSLRA
jgi:hypothetical protein